MCLLPILGQSSLTPNRDPLLLILDCYSVVPSDTMLRKGHAFVTALIIIIIINKGTHQNVEESLF